MRTGTAALRRILEEAGRPVACEACTYGASRYTTEDDRPVWTGLDIAHIVPVAADGTDDADNLAVLCRPCHESAPNTASRDAFLSWLERRQASGDGPGMANLRLLAEFLGDAGTRETFNSQLRDVPHEEIERIAREAAREAGASLRPTVHFGQGGWNYETTLAVMQEAIRIARARVTPKSANGCATAGQPVDPGDGPATASPAIAEESP